MQHLNATSTVNESLNQLGRILSLCKESGVEIETKMEGAFFVAINLEEGINKVIDLESENSVHKIKSFITELSAIPSAANAMKGVH